MKATFNRKSMLDAFATVSAVAPARSPKPILQNVKLAINDGEASLLGTDLEVGIRKSLIGVFAVDDGDAILSTARFGQILRASNDDELSLEIDDDKLIVKGGRSRFSLPSEDPALFPVQPDFDAANYMTLPGDALKRLIKRTSFAVDMDGGRYAIGGAFVEREPESVSFVCTDGRRLAKATTTAEWVGEVDGSARCILPLKAMKLIDRAIVDGGDMVHFAVETGTAAMFRTSDCVIYTRLVEGRFPAYRDVFPKSSRFTVPLDVASFRSAIEQAAITASEESRGVAFRFTPDGVELTCEAADVGESRVELPLFGSVGEDVVISMDPRYVVECLRNLEPDAPLTVDLVDGQTAALFKSGESYSYVVMPLTR